MGIETTIITPALVYSLAVLVFACFPAIYFMWRSLRQTQVLNRELQVAVIELSKSANTNHIVQLLQQRQADMDDSQPGPRVMPGVHRRRAD